MADRALPLLALAVVAAACTGGEPSQPDPDPVARAPIDPARGIDNIDHFVFIEQENRSFDHYFGTFPGQRDPPGRRRALQDLQPRSGFG